MVEKRLLFLPGSILQETYNKASYPFGMPVCKSATEHAYMKIIYSWQATRYSIPRRTWSAEAALAAVHLGDSLLYGMKSSAHRADGFDSGNVAPVHRTLRGRKRKVDQVDWLPMGLSMGLPLKAFHEAGQRCLSWMPSVTENSASQMCPSTEV